MKQILQNKELVVTGLLLLIRITPIALYLAKCLRWQIVWSRKQLLKTERSTKTAYKKRGQCSLLFKYISCHILFPLTAVEALALTSNRCKSHETKGNKTYSHGMKATVYKVWWDRICNANLVHKNLTKFFKCSAK